MEKQRWEDRYNLTLRQLEHAEQKLQQQSQTSSTASELKQQVDHLNGLLKERDRALEEAEKDKNAWNSQCNRMEQNRIEKDREITRLSNELAKAHQQMEQSHQHVGLLKDRERALTEVEKSRDAWNSQCNRMEQDKIEKDREVTRLSNELVKAHQQMEQSHQHVETTLQKLEQAQEQLDRTLAKLEDKHVEWQNAKSEVARLQCDNETWKQLAEQEHQKVKDLMAEGRALESRCHEVTAAKEEAYQRLQSILQNNDQNLGNVEALKAHYNHLLSRRQQEMNVLEQQLQQLQSSLQQERAQNEQIRREAGAFHDQLTAERNNRSQLEVLYTQKLDEERTELASEFQKQVTFWRSKYENAEQYGKQMQSQLVKDLEVNVQTQEALNAENNTAQENLRQAEREFQSLRHNCQELEAVVREKTQTIAQMLELLEGKPLTSTQETNTVLRMAQKALQYRSGVIEQVDRQVSAQNEEIEKLSAANSTLQEHIDVYHQDLELAMKEISLLKAECEQLTSTVSIHQQREGDFERLCAENENTQNGLSKRIEEQESMNQRLEARAIEMEEEILQLQEEKEQVLEQLSYHAEVNPSKIEWAEERLNSLQKENEALRKARDDLCLEKDKLERQLEHATRDIREMTQQVFEYEQHVDDLNRKNEQKAIEYDEKPFFKKECQRLQKALKAAETRCEALEEKRDAISEERKQGVLTDSARIKLETHVSKMKHRLREVKDALKASEDQKFAMEQQTKCLFERLDTVNHDYSRLLAEKAQPHHESTMLYKELEKVDLPFNAKDLEGSALIRRIIQYIRQLQALESVDSAAIEEENELLKRRLEAHKEKAAKSIDRLKAEWKKRYNDVKSRLKALQMETQPQGPMQVSNIPRKSAEVSKHRKAVLKLLDDDRKGIKVDVLQEHLAHLMTENVKLQHQKEFYKKKVKQDDVRDFMRP